MLAEAINLRIRQFPDLLQPPTNPPILSFKWRREKFSRGPNLTSNIGTIGPTFDHADSPLTAAITKTCWRPSARRKLRPYDDMTGAP